EGEPGLEGGAVEGHPQVGAGEAVAVDVAGQDVPLAAHSAVDGVPVDGRGRRRGGRGHGRVVLGRAAAVATGGDDGDGGEDDHRTDAADLRHGHLHRTSEAQTRNLGFQGTNVATLT